MEKITFPRGEHKKVIGLLKEREVFTTTRTAKDFYRLRLNKTYKFRRFRIKIVKARTLKKLTKHPFYKLLTKQMKESIIKGKKYSENNYAVFWLKRVNS